MHPMLVMFPTAFFPLLVLLDILRAYFPGDPAFWNVGFWVAAAGVLTTLLAMIPGLVDLAAIPDEADARRTALAHAAVGTLVLLLFVGSLAARWPAGSGDARFTWAVILDVAGLLAIAAQGWLGGELVYKHHIGVLSTPEGGEPVTLKEPGRAPSAARGGARRPGAERP
jgi:uncharacterized membrane protein